MKKFTLLIALPLVFLTSGFSQSCLPDGIYLNTQSAIDNFQINYPGCIEIEGDVHITGGDITNLDGLNVLTSIGGNLKCGGGYQRPPCPNLKSLSGLSNLVSIGGNLTIEGCHSLINLQGLENLTSIGGSLSIGVTFLKPIGNDSLISLAGIENIDPESIQSLSIANNPLLTTCAIFCICNYLAVPDIPVEIINNATGCNIQQEIEEACESVNIYENVQKLKIDIFPNPASDIITITCNSGMSIESINVYNQLGQKVLLEKGINKIIDISILRKGIYIVEFNAGGSKIRKKLVIKE